MATDAITAIKASLPPETDWATYLIIVESHLRYSSQEILPTLNELLKDPKLSQEIGWELMKSLLPLSNAEECLNTIARLGNPREVAIGITEALAQISKEGSSEDDDNDDFPEDKVDQDAEPKGVPADGAGDASPEPPTIVDKFCTLVSMVAIIYPRIKTKYPSRFLASSLETVLKAYRIVPTNQATAAVISMIHTLSGKKRPQVPRRTSSFASSLQTGISTAGGMAPDPEGTDEGEQPTEKAIQMKLLQSLVTHVLETYVSSNGLEWSTRLLEKFEPEKVVKGKTSISDDYKESPVLKDRDIVVGQLVALARDLGLSELEPLFAAIYPDSSAEDRDIDDLPDSPEEIPLCQGGCLILVTYFIFSSKMFDTKDPLPPLSIFSGHAKLCKQFLGVLDPQNVGGEDESIIDCILTIGLWIENANKFVSGPLTDEDFTSYLQTLSLLSANCPSPTLRNCAHVLTTSVLHAHPQDRLRLTFIIDTLEHCPYENLKASAVSWLKDEIITATNRKSNNLFSTSVAVASAQPYIFPDMSALAEAPDSEAWEDLRHAFTFHIAVLNFFYFVAGANYAHAVPPGTLTVAEEVYLGPLKSIQERLEAVLEQGGDFGVPMSDDESQEALLEVRLLGERLAMCFERVVEE